MFAVQVTVARSLVYIYGFKNTGETVFNLLPKQTFCFTQENRQEKQPGHCGQRELNYIQKKSDLILGHK